MKSKSIIIVAVGVLLIFIVGLLTYFWAFHGSPSNKSSDWADFSTYLSLFLSIGSLIVISYFSFLTYSINERSVKLTEQSVELTNQSTLLSVKVTEANENLNKHQTTPILDVFYDKSTFDSYLPTQSHYLINCSNDAAAVDIHLKFSITHGTEEKESIWINLNVLPPKEKIELKWILHESQFEICYTDILREKYYHCIFKKFNTERKDITKEEFESLKSNTGLNIRSKELNELFVNANDVWQNRIPNTDNYFNQFFVQISISN